MRVTHLHTAYILQTTVCRRLELPDVLYLGLCVDIKGRHGIGKTRSLDFSIFQTDTQNVPVKTHGIYFQHGAKFVVLNIYLGCGKNIFASVAHFH